MPTDASLWLLIRPDGTVHKLKAGGKYGEPQQGVAVPLPGGHGRLGDLDALQEEFKKSHDGKRLMLIDTASTIVPAEGGGEE